MAELKVITLAKEAKANSYSPYSQFPVGCALELSDGTYIQGVNVENASFGATNCAERSALFTAYSQGYRKDDICSLAISSDLKRPISPCAICRQVMLELLNIDTPIYMTAADGTYIKTDIKELVPFAFTDADLNSIKS